MTDHPDPDERSALTAIIHLVYYTLQSLVSIKTRMSKKRNSDDILVELRNNNDNESSKLEDNWTKPGVDVER